MIKFKLMIFSLCYIQTEQWLFINFIVFKLFEFLNFFNVFFSRVLS